MRVKFIIVTILIAVLTFGFGITYSFFSSSVPSITGDINIAKFIFNATQTDQLELPLSDLKPGDTREYLFSVSNNIEGNISKVLIQYKLTIKTFHFMPLVINLYSVNDGVDELVMTCDEDYTRNALNELVCNGETNDMGFTEEEYDDYKLRVEFPPEYNNEIYANLVDYISIEINSWQKIGGEEAQ